MDTPALVEPGVRTYLDRSLKIARAAKQKDSIWMYNVGFAIVLLVVVGGFLAYKYRGKQTPYERQEKMNESRHYVLSKLQRLAAVKRRETGAAITGLPTWGGPLDGGV